MWGGHVFEMTANVIKSYFYTTSNPVLAWLDAKPGHHLQIDIGQTLAGITNNYRLKPITTSDRSIG